MSGLFPQSALLSKCPLTHDCNSDRPSAKIFACQFLSPLIYVAVKHILLVIMKKPSLGLLLTARDGFDKDKCYIMVPWHMSVWIVEGHSGGNETANNLAVFCEQQTDRL